MNVTSAALMLLAGLLAGFINAVVGGGTLVTFPILLGAGLPPVAANVASNIGLAPGSISGAIGYRQALTMRLRPLIMLGATAVTGGAVGAIVLASLPATSFQRVAPFLIGGAVVLVLVEPAITRWLPQAVGGAARGPRWLLPVSVFASSVYGGYFGAGQSLILLAVLSLVLTGSLHQVNAVKNVVQAVDNGTSAVVLSVVAHAAWAAVGLLAAGAVLGGQIGGRYGQKLPATALRILVVVVGVIGIVDLA